MPPQAADPFPPFIETVGTKPEPEFDDIAELAAAVCSTPIALVTLLDDKMQYHKGSVGWKYDRLPRPGNFCEHLLEEDKIFEIRDARYDRRFCENPLVDREPGIRFYAGVPLYAPSGDKVGALSVLDSVRRELKPWQRRALTLLSRQVNARLELRLRRRAAEIFLEQAAHNDLLFTTFANSLPFPAYIKNREHRLLFYNAATARRFGVDETTWLGRSSYDLWPTDVADRIYAAEERVFITGEDSDLRIDLPPSKGRSAIFFMLHQRLCHVPAGQPVLGALALEIS